MRFEITAGSPKSENDGPDRASGLKGSLQRLVGLLTADNDDGEARRTALTAFAVRVASAIVLYGLQVAFARWLGGFEYGIFVFVWSCVLVIGGMASFGFPLSVARFIPEYRQTGQFDLLRGLLLSSRLLPVIASTAAAGILATIITIFPALVENYYILPLMLACLCMPAYTLMDVQDGIGRAQNWILLALLPPYIIRPVLLLAFMGGALYGGAPATTMTAMYCAIVSLWISTIVQTLVMKRKLGGLVEPGPRAHLMPFWFKVSVPICLVDSFYLFMTNTDILLLSALRTPEETGVYYAAIKTLAFIAFVSFAVAAAAAHKFSEYYAAGDHERLEEFTRTSIVWTFWPSLAGVLVMIALGRPILSLFGESFVAAYPVMIIVSIGLLARAVVGPLERLLNVTGHQGICARIYFLAFICNLVLNLALIPGYGILGAATATGMAYVVESILLARVVRKSLGLNVMIWHGRTAA